MWDISHKQSVSLTHCLVGLVLATTNGCAGGDTHESPTRAATGDAGAGSLSVSPGGHSGSATADAGGGGTDGAGLASDAGSGSGEAGSSASADGGRGSVDGGFYNVDITQTSTSGLSSGGFMAVQFHVAYSSIMKGAAVFAGGPFYCAQGSLTNAETQCQYPQSAPDVTPFLNAVAQYAAAGTVDPTSNLTAQHVFLFGGDDDQTVSPYTMDALDTFYKALVDPSNVDYVSRNPGTGHTMPTLTYGVACSETEAPYIGQCNYDGAGTALAQIYGTLTPAAATLGGSFLTLAQGNFIADPASHSLADTGYAYVPASCAAGEPCRIHVAFHGCLQEATGASGNDYYEHAGYNEWADTNHIIVLYPQTAVGTGSETNPNACWDWWGYDSADYANQNGPQMRMVRAMIAYLAGQ